MHLKVIECEKEIEMISAAQANKNVEEPNMESIAHLINMASLQTARSLSFYSKKWVDFVIKNKHKFLDLGYKIVTFEDDNSYVKIQWADDVIERK